MVIHLIMAFGRSVPPWAKVLEGEVLEVLSCPLCVRIISSLLHPHPHRHFSGPLPYLRRVRAGRRVAGGQWRLSEPSPPPFSSTFCFSPPLLLLSISLQQLPYRYLLVLFCCTFLFYPFVASTLFLILIITSLFPFLALDIPFNIGHLPFAAQLSFFFSCSLPFVSLVQILLTFLLCGPRG